MSENTSDHLRAALQRRLDETDAEWVMGAFIKPLLVAQSSADTETLRARVWEVSGPSSVDDGGPYMAGWNAAMTEIRAALEGTK